VSLFFSVGDDREASAVSRKTHFLEVEVVPIMSETVEQRLKIPRTDVSLPIMVRDKVAQLILDRTLIPGSRLPNEFDLARVIGVSRGSLREGLRLLEEDGLIVRHPGIGTYVKDAHLIARNPLEANFSVTEIIKSMNSKPGTVEMEIKLIRLNQLMSSKLTVQVGSSAVFMECVRTADQRPVVYAMNVLPLSIISKEKRNIISSENLLRMKRIILEKFGGSLYGLLEQEYDQRIDYGIGKVLPAVADANLSEKLQIDIGLPLLLIEQINFSPQNNPILYNREYWIKDSFEFTIFRKRRPKREIT